MKKILFITPRNPYSDISGGTIVTKTAIEMLSNKFCLDLFYLELNCNTDIIKNDKVHKIYKINHKIKSKNLLTIISELFSTLPLSIYRNNSKFIKDKLATIIYDYDVVYVDHWLMMQFIPQNFKGDVLLREHNAEYKMWERYFNNCNSLIKKIYLKYEISKIKKYECEICNRATKVLVLSEEDKNNLYKIGVKLSKLIFLPAIVVPSDKLVTKNFKNKENALLYIGTFAWEANVDGLDYFLKNIYPKVKERVKNVKFYIVGKNPPQKLLDYSLNDSSIVFTGFVENLSEIYNKAKIFITYLRFGSGIKIKILEALSNGLPVVANDIGLEGIDTNATMEGKSDSDFAMHIVHLLKDYNLLDSMSVIAINYMKDNYSETKFQNVINSIIQN